MSEFVANERSEGSKLITEMNRIFDNNDLQMDNAVGELSLKSNDNDGRNNTLFPDAVIFEDKYRNNVLMGWEFKMPDVSIDNKELYNNAMAKANRMGTQVFVLWNFQYASIYIKNKKGWPIEPTKIFSDFSNILKDRESVRENYDSWKKQLKEVILYLNKEIHEKTFKPAPIDFNISNYVHTISNRLAPMVAAHYMNSDDVLLRNTITYWYKEEQSELNKMSKSASFDLMASSFARNIVIRWINRIIFSHIIKTNQNKVYDALKKFNITSDIKQFSNLINEAINTSDFFTLLHVNTDEFETYLPQIVIDNLNEFNSYLWHSELSLRNINKNFVSKLLEGLVSVSSRELMGLYKTPAYLAKILVGITIKKASGNFADITVGSGTISSEIHNKLLEYGKSEKYIHDHVWSSDKYSYPLQIANLNMTTPDSLNLKNIVYRHNALNLEVGEKIKIVNPQNGSNETLSIPKFDYIISNLPFVNSNRRDKEDKKYIDSILQKYPLLNNKMDLYQAILIHINELLSNNSYSRIGVITSNSWFKVQKKHKSFYKIMENYYDVESILIPDYGRWFDNAAVSTTIIILKKKRDSNKDKYTNFIKIDGHLRDENSIESLLLSINLNKSSKLYSNNMMNVNSVIKRIDMGMSIESLFDNSDFIELFDNVLSPISKFLEGGRGTRTGGDKIFIMDKPKVDSNYCIPYLKTIKDVNSYSVKNNKHYLFYTSDDLNYLKSNNMDKTLNYLKSISSNATSISRKNKKGDKWFNADQAPQYADFVTSINPQDRYFWSMMLPRMAVNQRLTAFRIKDKYNNPSDKNLIHAILNSVFAQYMLASSGFGRGEGVTDLTKDGIMQIYIPDIDLINSNNKQSILKLWDDLKTEPIMTIFEQLDNEKWIHFNKYILKSLNIDEMVFYKISSSLKNLINRRMSSKY